MTLINFRNRFLGRYPSWIPGALSKMDSQTGVVSVLSPVP